MNKIIREVVLFISRLLFKSGAKILIKVADTDGDEKLSVEEIESMLYTNLESLVK